MRARRRRNRNLNRLGVAARLLADRATGSPRAIQSYTLGPVVYAEPRGADLSQAYGKNRLVTSLIHLLRRPRLLIYRRIGHFHFFHPAWNDDAVACARERSSPIRGTRIVLRRESRRDCVHVPRKVKAAFSCVTAIGNSDYSSFFFLSFFLSSAIMSR